MHLFDEAVNLSSESINSGSECSDTKEVINQNKVKSMATQLLAKFEENAPNTSLRRQGSLRKEFPPNIGGSDTCYFCKKRVYVVERLSAEGHFFHRECFKCSFCSSVLRLGNYVFNMEEGKFYCQPHFMHSFSNSKQRKRRTDSKTQDPDKTWKKEEAITAEVTTDSPCSAGSSSEDSSPGIMSSLYRKTLSWPLKVTRDVLAIPSRLSNWTRGAVQDAKCHIRDNEQKYSYLYELLSVSVPFLYALYEVLTLMVQEAGPSLQFIVEQAHDTFWYKHN